LNIVAASHPKHFENIFKILLKIPKLFENLKNVKKKVYQSRGKLDRNRQFYDKRSCGGVCAKGHFFGNF
jgi:hypothetical protein